MEADYTIDDLSEKELADLFYSDAGNNAPERLSEMNSEEIMQNDGRTESSPTELEAPRSIQYLFFKTDPLWRRLPEEERAKGRRELGRREFAQAVEGTSGVQTSSCSTLGLKIDADFMPWRIADALDALQDMLGQLLQTGPGKYVQPTYSLFSMTRPSVYKKRRTTGAGG
ncbi:MAG: chlorite dismutase family protein [Chloroflexota bacterium]